jgi:hypothetical protein
MPKEETTVFVSWGISEDSQVLTGGQIQAFALKKKRSIVVVVSNCSGEVTVLISVLASQEEDCLHKAGNLDN